MKYAEKMEINRKKQNGYIKEAAGKVLDMIKAGDRDDADASVLSDSLYFLREAVEFEIEKKKTTVHIAYERIFSFASSLERNYNVDKNDTARLLFSPLFPSIELSNDELALLEFTDDEYAADAVRIQTLIKTAAVNGDVKNAKKTFHSLQKKGFFTTVDGKTSLVYDFPSSIPPSDEGNDGEWYVDDDFNLGYGTHPERKSLFDLLIESFKKDEEDYQTNWWNEIEKENERLTALFADDLANLKETTRGYYLSDIWWFLDSYFYYETIESIHEAAKNIVDFFRYYICRGHGHSEYLVKRMASAVRRFYSVMYRNGEVSEEEYLRVISDIKDNIAWLLEASTDYEARIRYFS